jgi:beta-N-acetylhexosaminidase
MNFQDFKKNPYFLDNDACDWVCHILSAMTLEEKIGQIFCPTGSTADDPNMIHALDDIGVGGMMMMPGKVKTVQKLIRFAKEHSKIPMLFAANLESGGKGLVLEGTEYGSPMLLSAGGDPEAGYRLGKICATEAKLVGANWSFAPIVDLDMNFRNTVVNIRSFGNDPDTVICMAGGYLKAAKEENLAVTVKHFPGDGTDYWDHHYGPSTNSLTFEAWDKSYGRIYRAMFEQGALTVMAGHISLPDYVRRENLEADPYAPATVCPMLLRNLLREHLGFNGMVVTDSNNMLGLLTYLPRRKAIPAMLESGCDMILFNKSLDEDICYLRDGLSNGMVSVARLDEAVARILAVKASLGLHLQKPLSVTVSKDQFENPVFSAWSMEAVGRGITLVKDTQTMLPLSPQKYPRLYLNVLQEEDDPDTPLRQEIKAAFEKEGFRVFLRDRTKYNGLWSSMEENNKGVALMTEHYDAAVYVVKYNWGDELAMHLSWKGFHARGNDAPWFIAELPTMMISMGYPYYLNDVPMMKTYVNTYGMTPYTLDALMAKLCGREPFTGISPIDPFCGRNEARV